MVDFITKWKQSLTKTRNQTFSRFATILGSSDVTSETWEELETLLLQSDMGVQTTSGVLTTLKKNVSSAGVVKWDRFKQLLEEELIGRLDTRTVVMPQAKPVVILVVGINGSGKTTTMAKLGAYYKDAGKSVMFAAADTFRAAAVDQLQTWGTRLGIPVIAGQEDADPGAVVYDAVTAASTKNVDILLVDTAGRLHTRFNLMEELKKIYRVCGKALPGAPHFVWLVLDATTGQNAFQQAKVFKEAVKVDGVILAKLDSSAKGGMVFAIREQLDLPVLFTGLGEQPSDFEEFSPEKFVEGLLSE